MEQLHDGNEYMQDLADEVIRHDNNPFADTELKEGEINPFEVGTGPLKALKIALDAEIISEEEFHQGIKEYCEKNGIK